MIRCLGAGSCRIQADDETWKAFRLAAVDLDVSSARYLGEIAEAEAHRLGWRAAGRSQTIDVSILCIGGTVLRGRSGSTRRSVWCQTVPWEGVRSGQRGMIVFAMTGPLAGTNPVARKP